MIEDESDTGSESGTETESGTLITSDSELMIEHTTLFKWKIRNFSVAAVRDDSKKVLKSDYFRLDSSLITCYLTFYPVNTDEEDKDFSSLFLYVQHFDGRPTIKLTFDMWIENELGDKIVKKISEIEHIFKRTEHFGYGHPNLVHHDLLYPPKNQFVKNDTVIICIRIRRGDVLPERVTKFNQNIWDSFKEGLRGECTLEIPGAKIKVSKTLLTAHSKVFKSMFTLDMKENQDNVVKLNHINKKTLRGFIQYLHMGSVNNLSEIAMDLFKMADMYDIVGLRSQCAQSISKTLSKDNFFELLTLVFMHGCDEFKSNVLDYISHSKDGIYVSMICSDEWIDFAAKNRKLANEITEAVCKKLNYTH